MNIPPSPYPRPPLPKTDPSRSHAYQYFAAAIACAFVAALTCIYPVALLGLYFCYRAQKNEMPCIWTAWLANGLASAAPVLIYSLWPGS